MAQSAEISSVKEFDRISDQNYTSIFNTYWKKLYAIAYHRLRDEDLAKDIVQDVFVYCWNQRHQIVINLSIEAYLRAALQNQIVAHFRKEDIRSKAFAYLYERMVQVEEQIKDVLTAKDLEKTVDAEMSEMPETMRQIFKLRIRDYSVPEIAGSLDIAEKTVRNNLSMGVGRIRKAIAKDFPEGFSAVSVALYVILT